MVRETPPDTDPRPHPEPPADRHARRSPTGGDSRLRRLTDGDARGQAGLLGAILLFGLLIALLVLIQVAAVPGWNQQLEFQHSQRVSEDFQQMSQIMSDVAADGGDRSAVVELGLRYPPRPFLFNPPPPTGSIETTSPSTATIQNAELSNVDNYDISSESFETSAIQYEAGYNEYRDNPEMTYEYGLLVNEFPNGFQSTTKNQRVVNGTNVNLVLVDGDLSESTTATTTVPIEGTSAPTTGVTVESADGGDIVVTLPTELSQSTWENALQGEIDGGALNTDDSATRHVKSVTVSGGVATIRLEGDEQYNFRMAEVGVGDGYTDEPARYITTKGDSTRVVARNTTNDITAEVRDKFNNPVGGTEVTFTIVNGTGASFENGGNTMTATTSENGEASVGIETLDDDTVYVRATYGTAPFSDNRETLFRVEAVEGGIRATGGDGTGDGEGTDDPVSGINPAPDSGGVRFLSGNNPPGQDYSELTFDNDATTTMEIERVRVSYYFDGQGTTPPANVQFSNSDGTSAVTGDVPSTWITFNGPTLLADDPDEGATDDGNPADQRTIRIAFDGTRMDPSDFAIVSIEFDIGGGGTQIYSYFITPNK